MQLNGGSSGTAFTAVSTAMKFNPATAPFAPLVSFAGAISSIFGGGHVPRPTYYADLSVTNDGFSIVKIGGDSDASSKTAKSEEKNPALQVARIVATELVALTKSFGANINAPFNLGAMYEGKYVAIFLVVGATASRVSGLSNRAKSYNISASVKTEKELPELVAFLFLTAIKKNLISVKQQVYETLKNISLSSLGTSVQIWPKSARIPADENNALNVLPKLYALNQSIKNENVIGGSNTTQQNTNQTPNQSVNPATLLMLGAGLLTFLS